MKFKLATSRERMTARTVAALERAITDSTRPEKIRRACALRLARLRAATKRPATATRPAPNVQSLTRGVALARETFLTLAAQRSALVRKAHRTAADNIILGTLLDQMPAAIPAQDASTAAWCDFVEQVTDTLAAIKELPHR